MRLNSLNGTQVACDLCFTISDLEEINLGGLVTKAIPSKWKRIGRDIHYCSVECMEVAKELRDETEKY